MLLFRKVFGSFVVFVISLSVLLSFQNCSPVKFETTEIISQDLASEAPEDQETPETPETPVPEASRNICHPFETRLCSIENGVGEQKCSASGEEWSECLVQSCNNGFTRQGEKCVVSPCGNGAVNPPSCNQCASQNILVNGQCVAQVCSPGSLRNCSIQNGVGQQECNSSGTGYGVCALVQCNTGYVKSGNTCILNPQVCSPGSNRTCAIQNGVGQQTCNGSGTGYGACNVVQCNAGYTANNNTCVQVVQKVCTPNSTQSCQVPNGTGQQICNSQGSGYGSCSTIGCNTGYSSVNGTCVKNAVCATTAPVPGQFCTVGAIASTLASSDSSCRSFCEEQVGANCCLMINHAYDSSKVLCYASGGNRALFVRSPSFPGPDKSYSVTMKALDCRANSSIPQNPQPLDPWKDNKIDLCLTGPSSFNADQYLAANPDVYNYCLANPFLGTPQNCAYQHFIQQGQYEETRPMDVGMLNLGNSFPRINYLLKNADVALSGVRIFPHYQACGRAEQRSY